MHNKYNMFQFSDLKIQVSEFPGLKMVFRFQCFPKYHYIIYFYPS